MTPCSKCAAENTAGSRFCNHCGNLLQAETGFACRHCGFANALGVKFCGGCGQPTSATLPKPDAERRHLTVMFCDLCDSTALSTRLDPEDHREVLRAYQAACAQVVARYEGHLAQYLGDGVMAYFGYPKAHEDDAERATRAGLEIVETIAALAPLGVAIRTRVGIATGLAVVGDKIAKGSDWEVGVVGETPNLAARLQSVARPGEVVVGPPTRQLLGGQFEYVELGEHSLKGFAEPVRAFRVLSAVALGSRFKALRRFNVELVGRRDEQALLQDLATRAAQGEGRAALIQGEAGIGKSKLAHTLAEWMASAFGARLVELQCSAHHTQSALFPVANALRQSVFGDWRCEGAAPLGSGTGRPADGSPWDTLAAFLTQTLAERAGAVLPVFADLLSIPAPEGHPAPPPPERQAILHHLLDLLAGGNGPVLLLLEDLHWADPFTLEFAEHLVGQCGARPLFALFTGRPEFAPEWLGNPGATLVPLGRLPDVDAAELVRRAAGGQTLGREAVEAVVAKTDGVPLYLLEYAKAVAESGAQGGQRVIPSSLHDLLLARLDRLGDAKAVAQTASLLGREFDVRLLEAVWEPGPDALSAGLNRLLAETLVQPKGEPTRRRYEFRHALIQDAAYESLLKSHRAAAHGRIAETVERNFPEIAEAEPEWLAQHFCRAGLPGRAIPHWERAGLKANKLTAYTEACRHFRSALAQLAALDEGPERHSRELGLTIQLGMALQAAYGYAIPELAEVYQRARTLCGLLGDTAELYPVLRGLSSFYIVRCDLVTALELSEQCVRLGRETGRPEYQIEAYNSLGYSLGFAGQIEPAVAALAEGVRLYRAFDGENLAYPSPHDPLMGCLALLAKLSWMQGQARLSLRTQAELRETLEGHDRPFDHTYGYSFLAYIELLRRRYDLAAHWADIAAEAARRGGYKLWLDTACCTLASAQARQGDAVAIAAILATIEARQANYGILFESYFFAELAESYRVAGEPLQALAAVEAGFASVRAYGEGYHFAEHHRIRGELRAALGDMAQGEADLRAAIRIAEGQGAALFQLRAALVLHRLGLGGEGETCCLLETAAARIDPEDGAHIEEWQEAARLLA